MLRQNHTNLSALMEMTSGSSDVGVGLIDGPVDLTHPDLANAVVHQVGASGAPICGTATAACRHGTFVAGMLAAVRGSGAPAICPGCTFFICPILSEPGGASDLPQASAAVLASAIVACVVAGVRVINLSLGLSGHVREDPRGLRDLEESLDYAGDRGTIVVAAAGNKSTVGGSLITSHPWVLAVAACDSRGWPTGYSNLSGSIGRRGLLAPGAAVRSLAPGGATVALEGTSVAAPFVTGAVALLSSLFPTASAAEVRRAIAGPTTGRTSITPPVLDAQRALRELADTRCPAHA